MKKILIAGSLGIILLLAAFLLPASASNYTYRYTGPTDYYTMGYANYYTWYPTQTTSWRYNYNWNSNWGYTYPHDNYNQNRNWHWNANMNSNVNQNTNGGGTVCTMDYRYGLTVYLQDEAGQPLSNATFTATKDVQTVNDFQSFQGGLYSGIGEGNGYYTVTIQRPGYSTHRETLKLERDTCHVIQQIRTVTLFQ